MSESADIGFLNDVFSLAVVAQDAAGEPVKPAVVRFHDGMNGALLSLAGAPHEIGVFRFAGRNPGYLWLGRHDQGWELNVGCPSPEKVPASKNKAAVPIGMRDRCGSKRRPPRLIALR